MKTFKKCVFAFVFLGILISAASAVNTGIFAYHGNIKSKIFHSPACRYYDCKKCTKVFNSKTEAVKAGYRACKVCKP